MYAIRSYYADGHARERPEAPAQPHRFRVHDGRAFLRITSYNVCYTKLLRDLREADIEEEPFHHAGKYDEAAQKLLVVFGRPRPERRIGQRVDERDQKLVLVANRRNLVVGIEYLALIELQTLDDILVSVGA